MNTSGPLSPILALRVLLPFALGYFLSYLFRTVNAVIAPDLVADLGLTAADLGLLTSTYFLTFAAFQLPLGILLDRFGPRKTEALLLLFAAVGAAVFALAESRTGLIIGRGLIGFGVSACLMAAFKAFVSWFPSQRLPQVNGVQMAAGGFGALAATAPVEMLLHVVDWRGLFLIVAAFSLVVAACVLLVVPERREEQVGATLGDALDGIRQVFTSPVFWRTAPLTVMSQASFLSIQSLWSGPWMRDVAHLERADVATNLLLIAAAMVAGFLFMGTLAERLSRTGISPMTVAVGGMMIFMLAQSGIILEFTGLALPLWIAFGFFGTTGILPYAALSQAFPPHLAGRVNTGVNLLVFVLAFAAQWSIGAIIDLWDKAAGGGYAPQGFQAAFAAMLATQVAGLVWFALRRDIPIRRME